MAENQTKLSVPGRPTKPTDKQKAEENDLQQYKIEVLDHHEVTGIVRGEALTRETIGVYDDTDVVELQFDGGVVEYVSVAALKKETLIERGSDGGEVTASRCSSCAAPRLRAVAHSTGSCVDCATGRRAALQAG